MRETPAWPRPATVRALLVAAALAALFALHGLSDHGAQYVAPQAAPMAGHGTAPQHQDLPGDPSATAGPAAWAAAGHDAGHDAGHGAGADPLPAHHGLVAGLCLAVLLPAGLLAAGLFARRLLDRARPWPAAFARQVAANVHPPCPPPRPPRLHVLAVLRC